MSGFHPIRTERIYQKIVNQVQQMLHSGQLAPGDRLPSEREIAEQLGVSRPAVREALSALEMMGLLEVRPGEGTFVKAGEFIAPFALLLSMGSEFAQATEMFEIRRPLEGEAAALAAERATEEDLKRIQECIERMEIDMSRADLGEASDWEFHMAISLASHNGLLVRVMYHLQDSLRSTVQTARQRLFQIPGMPQRLLDDHRAILAAITTRDPNQARETMIRHITEAQQNSGL